MTSRVRVRVTTLTPGDVVLAASERFTVAAPPITYHATTDSRRVTVAVDYVNEHGDHLIARYPYRAAVDLAHAQTDAQTDDRTHCDAVANPVDIAPVEEVSTGAWT